MKKLEFTNDNSIIKKKPVAISIDDYNRFIRSVIYGYGNNSTIYGKYPGARDEILEKQNIVDAGYLFLLSSPQMFYQVYTIIENASDKEALGESLHKVYEEYKGFHLNSINGNLEYKESWLPRCMTVPTLYTLKTPLYQMSYDIKLDDNNNLASIKSQYRNLGQYGRINEYKRDVTEERSDNPFFPSWYYHVLTHEVTEQYARAICQSDIGEYQKLLDSMNHSDEYYESIVYGGASFTDDIQRLIRKCKL